MSTKSCRYDHGNNKHILTSLYATTKLLPTTASFVLTAVPLI